MKIDTFNICLICVEIIFYSFHFTVFLLLILQRNKKFKGAFYDLIRTIFIADFVFIIAQFQIRLPTFDLWPEFYKTHGNMAAIILNTTGYCAFVQFFAHALIAFNRFTIFWLPIKHSTIWSKHWYTIITVILPLIAISHRIFEPGIFAYNENGEVFSRFSNDLTRTIAYYITSSVFTFMTIIQAFCNLLAVIKFYYYKKLNTQIDSNEVRLLSLSCILFLIQWLRCAHNFGRLIFPQNEYFNLVLQTLLPLISDLYAWTGSFSIIILSPSIRNAYLKLFCKCLINKNFHSGSTTTPLQQYPITFISTPIIISTTHA